MSMIIIIIIIFYFYSTINQYVFYKVYDANHLVIICNHCVRTEWGVANESPLIVCLGSEPNLNKKIVEENHNIRHYFLAFLIWTDFCRIQWIRWIGQNHPSMNMVHL